MDVAQSAGPLSGVEVVFDPLHSAGSNELHIDSVRTSLERLAAHIVVVNNGSTNDGAARARTLAFGTGLAASTACHGLMPIVRGWLRDGVRTVPAPSASVLLISRAGWGRFRGLDRAVRLYSEDLELCAPVRQS